MSQSEIDKINEAFRQFTVKYRNDVLGEVITNIRRLYLDTSATHYNRDLRAMASVIIVAIDEMKNLE